MANKISFKTDKSIQSIVQIIAVTYLLVWSVAPPLQIDLIFRLLALGLAVVWFFIEFLKHFEFTKMQIWAAIFMAGVVIIAYIKGGMSSILSEIAIYMMVLAYFTNLYMEDEWQNYRLIVPLVIILLLYFNFRTIQVLSSDTSIARQIVRNDENMYVYMRQGVGGYGLVYPEVVISPVVYAWTFKSFENNKFYFLLGVAWTVSFVWMLNLAGYSIAIFASAVSLIILLFYRRRSFLPAFLVSVAVIGSVVLALVYWESFRNLVMRIFDGTKVVRKIEDLVSSVEGDEMAFSFAERIRRYGVSLKNIFMFPVVGGALLGGGTGGHSAVLDTIATYGLWGGIPYCYMMFHTPNAFKTEEASSTIIATANAHLTAIAFVGLFDPFPFQMYFPLMILCPIMYSDIMVWTGELDEDSVDG